MSKRFTFIKTLLVAVGITMGANAWAQTTTLLEYGTTDVAWTEENLATWTAGGTPTLADGIVTISGGNGSYATSKTISPTDGTVINLSAVWRGRSNTGRYFSNSNGSYFRFGNIYVAQNDQDQKHGYGLSGLANISSSTTFTAGSYRVDITSSTWLKIEAEINTATNTLTSFSIKSEDGATTYVNLSDVALTSPDYTTVAFGYQKGSSVSTTNTEQLKSVKITETVQSATFANYTVHFVDGDGATVKADEIRSGEVGTTVNANSADKENIIEGDYKYVYSNDGGGVDVTSDGNAELTVTYEKISKFTYSVIAVDESSNPLGTIASSTVFNGESAFVIWSKYIEVAGQWYVTDDNEFSASSVAAGEKEVTYKPANIAYFFEMEKLSRSGGAFLTEENSSYSNNARLRLSKGSLYYTPALTAGIYQLTINCVNSNASANEVYVYTRSNDGDLSDILFTHVAASGTTTLSCIVEVPEGYSIAFNGNEGSYNNNARMDYMTLAPATVSKTISAAGYATFCSEYALNFEAVTGLKAYIAAKDGEGNITFQQVDHVPANTGVLLQGEANTYEIPVVAGSTTDVSGNALIGVTAETAVAAGSFVLMNGASGVAFYKAKSEFTVGANTAYIAALAGVRDVISIDGEATGISSVHNSESIMHNEIFNLKGQRVEKAQKGLYIIGGKKAIVK